MLRFYSGVGLTFSETRISALNVLFCALEAIPSLTELDMSFLMTELEKDWNATVLNQVKVPEKVNMQPCHIP